MLSAPPLTLKRALTTRVPSQKRNICPRLPSILTPLLVTFHRFAILSSLSRVPCLIIRNKMHLTSRFSFYLSLFFHFLFFFLMLTSFFNFAFQMRLPRYILFPYLLTFHRFAILSSPSCLVTYISRYVSLLSFFFLPFSLYFCLSFFSIG